MTAREIAEGQLWEAINSYWGMLLSLILSPFIFLGIPPIPAFKIVQFLVGLFTIFFVIKWVRRLQLPPLFSTSLLGVLTLLIWMCSLSHTPDLLMVLLLLIYFLQIADAKTIYQKSPWLIGLIGGLLFWCKSYGLPFFIAHFSLWNAYLFFQSKRNKSTSTPSTIRSFYLKGLLSFSLVSFLLIGLLSFKYGSFTTGSSGSYNMNYMGPIMNFIPPYFDAYQNPDTEFTNYIIAEEQGLFGAYGDWSMFESKANFQHYLQRIKQNFSKFYYITYLRDLLILLILFGLLFGINRLRLTTNQKELIFAIIGFLAIYTGGYFLLFPNERYLWINHFLLSGLLFILFAKTLGTSGLRWTVMIGLFAFVMMQSINILDRAAFRSQECAFYQDWSTLEKALNTFDLNQKNILSNIAPTNAKIPDYMDPVCLLMYQYRFKVWGFFRDKKIKTDLQLNQISPTIDYFFLWEADETLKEKFNTFPLIFHHKETGLHIYDLRKDQ